MTETVASSDSTELPDVENRTESKELSDKDNVCLNPPPTDDSNPFNEKPSNEPSQEPQGHPKSPDTNLGKSLAQNSANTNLSGPCHSAPQLTVEQQLQKSKRDLESMVLRYAKSERENLQNKMKVDELDKKLKRAIRDNDQLANRLKLLTNDKSQLTDTLNAKVAQLTVLEQKNLNLNNLQGVKLKEYEEKMKKLEATNEDLLKSIESYKSKEGELLDFSERLSMKHMMLQSELNEALKKVPNYKEQYESTLSERDNLAREKEELSSKIEFISESLKKEQEMSESLRAELKEKEVKYGNDLDKLQNEIKVMRRKHQNATKDLVKEIKLLQSQLEKVAPTTNQSVITAS